jgi:type IV secretion system protein TrbB
MLRTALGPAIAAWLEDPGVIEVMLNPDGRIWIDRLTDGLADTGEWLAPADGERIIRLVAHHVGTEVQPGSPRVSAELPETGERFDGLLPPIVAAPAFAIRKPAVAIFTLEDYIAFGIMLPEQATVLRLAVEKRLNVLVAASTSTGKTTLVNALLAEVAKTSDRVILIEDTRELHLVALRTKDGVASLSDLVRSSLRLRPDCIPIGEVRGAEALDLLKAWGTGHPGGIGTIHAGSALGALRRLEQLIQEAVVTVPRALIAETTSRMRTNNEHFIFRTRCQGHGYANRPIHDRGASRAHPTPLPVPGVGRPRWQLELIRCVPGKVPISKWRPAMRRVVSLFLQTWPTDRVRRTLGAAAPPAEAPLVLIGQEGRRRVVLAMDAAAQRAGLRVGMPATKVQALVVPGLIVMDADPAADAGALNRPALWALQRYAELIAVRDYFRVEDEAGERFWIYRAGNGEDTATGSHHWFLHGIFG